MISARKSRFIVGLWSAFLHTITSIKITRKSPSTRLKLPTPSWCLPCLPCHHHPCRPYGAGPISWDVNIRKSLYVPTLCLYVSIYIINIIYIQMCIYYIYIKECVHTGIHMWGEPQVSHLADPSRNDSSTELSWTYTHDITHISGYAGK